MRILSSSLESAQKAGALNPLYKIVLTKGAATYTYGKDRILPSAHDEEPYSHKATILIDNHDNDLDDKDLKGYKGILSLGVITKAGEEYSAMAPLWVMDQQFDSDPNKLTCTLDLQGAFNLMAGDEASENYIPDADDTKTVKELVNAILGKTLAPFAGCATAFEVVWDDGYDPLADNYKPKDGFRIYVGGTRLAALRRVLDYTSNVARWEADGKVHILKPVTSGVVYDYEYSLERGDHKFFSKAYKNTLVIPNRIYVISYEDDEVQYLGVASVSGYASLPDEVKKIRYIQMKLESNAQADSIAEALIAKAEMWSKRGAAPVPLNVGQEVFDYVKVTDSRQGDTRTGNLGYVHRRFGKDTWKMTFGFGNWLDYLRYNEILKGLETYTDSGNYFPRLKVGTLYAYLDEIQDGPDLYIRQKYLHLDATGVYVEETTLYAVRLPGEAQHHLWKATTAPDDPETGDFWLDTNYEPNKVMIWDGNSWEEATAAQLANFNRATIVRIWKASALTADGLVVLDETQQGTYGLMLSTDIQAGHALLSKTVKDGLWYEETGVVLDATYGIALYGGEGINAFRTFATKAHYDAGTPVQVYIGTDGKLYAGGGGVWMDYLGLSTNGTSIRLYHDAFYGGCLGISESSPYEFVVQAMSGNPLYLGTEITTGGDIWLNPDSNYVLPYNDNDIRLGSTSKQFYGGYFKSRLKIPVGTDMYD